MQSITVAIGMLLGKEKQLQQRIDAITTVKGYNIWSVHVPFTKYVFVVQIKALFVY